MILGILRRWVFWDIGYFGTSGIFLLGILWWNRNQTIKMRKKIEDDGNYLFIRNGGIYSFNK